MNAAVCILYNTTPHQLDLAKAAVDSLWAQDIPGGIHLWIVDNGSDIDTMRWIKGMQAPEGHSIAKTFYETNQSPVRLVNETMEMLFEAGYQYIFGLPGDVVLSPNCYREFLRWPRGIVTGSMTDDEKFPVVAESRAVNTCTPMAVALIRKWCHDALVAKDGYFFCPDIFHYASDNDMALRLAACGIAGVQTDVQYWHSGSASWRLARPEVARAITVQADLDRATFERRWGFRVDSPLYGQTAADINFRGEPRRE